jgi:replicative DNA helicase
VQAERISKLPMWINDQLYTIEEICSWARMMKSRHDIGLFTFDYLGLAGVGSGSGFVRDNPVERNTYVARCLKTLARELDIPVLALSQLSRKLEGDSKKGPRDPVLSDLRDSGEIEAAADKVLFLYLDREKKAEMEADKPGSTIHKRPVWVDVQKHKNGETARIPFWMHAPYFMFEMARCEGAVNFTDDAVPGDAKQVQEEYAKVPNLIPRGEYVL